VTRRYAAPLTVHTSVHPSQALRRHPEMGPSESSQPAPIVPPIVPIGFVWRGRRYAVRSVIAQWQERRAWWREALDPAPGEPHGIGAAARERHVWRVEASVRPDSAVAVVELSFDASGMPPWQLTRVVD